MKFNSLKDFILYNFDSPIPVDVKIGDEFAAVKVGRAGYITTKKYVPTKSYDIDISSVKDKSHREIEKYKASIIGKDLDSGGSMVAVINSKIATVRKINQYTTIVFYLESRFDFDDENDMVQSIGKIIGKTNVL